MMSPKEAAGLPRKQSSMQLRAQTSSSLPAIAFRDGDYSGTDEVRFWIKTDIAGSFSFQMQSGNGKASIFKFSTTGMKPESWQQIVAPVAKFTIPPWAKAGVDWASVRRWQIVEFGRGPYDGR